MWPPFHKDSEQGYYQVESMAAKSPCIVLQIPMTYVCSRRGADMAKLHQIGRASRSERVFSAVYISVVAVS